MIVVLNGPSSTGKSTLAAALRHRLGIGCVAVSVDRLFAFAHPEHPKDWRMFAALSDAAFASAAAVARAGYKVIVDTVFERRENLDSAQRAFADLRYALVAVTCDVDVFDAREHTRGNRPSGLARRQHGSVMHDARYDVQIDTTAASVQVCVERVLPLFQ